MFLGPCTEDAVLLLDCFDDLLFEALHQPLPPPWLHGDLEDQEQQHVHAHQAPGAPRRHPSYLVGPDLLFMVAGEDAPAELGGSFLSVTLRSGEGLLRLCLRNLVGVVVAVEGSEAFQVDGRPGVLALQKLVYLPLGGRAAVYSGGVGFLGPADLSAGFLDLCLCM